MLEDRELLRAAYADFNARRMEDVLARLHPNVEWANGMEGGHELGREAVRAYWTRQWGILDPKVEPLGIEPDGAGRMVVLVHQVVHDKEGKLLMDRNVRHAYRIEEGLILRMDILDEDGSEEK